MKSGRYLTAEEQLNHDIRGSLSPIYTYLDLLAETHLNHDQTELVDKIKKSTLTVLNIINGAVDSADLSSDTIEKVALNKKTALLIEDDELSRTALTAMLKSWGADCDSLEINADAAAMITAKNYDFIITDYFQKNDNQNGLDFILNLKNQSGHKINKSVLVMISGSASVLQKSKSAVDLCFLKPINAGSFYELLVSALKKNENKIIDEQRVAHYQKTQLLGRLFAIFETDVPRQIEGLRLSIDQRDLEKINYYAHCLCSKAKTMGALKMFDYCFELESKISSSQLDDVFSLIEKIELNYKESLKYIKIKYNL